MAHGLSRKSDCANISYVGPWKIDVMGHGSSSYSCAVVGHERTPSCSFVVVGHERTRGFVGHETPEIAGKAAGSSSVIFGVVIHLIRVGLTYSGGVQWSNSSSCPTAISLTEPLNFLYFLPLPFPFPPSSLSF